MGEVPRTGRDSKGRHQCWRCSRCWRCSAVRDTHAIGNEGDVYVSDARMGAARGADVQSQDADRIG